MKTIVFTLALFAIFGLSSAGYTICFEKVGYTAFNFCPFSKEDSLFTKDLLFNQKLTFGLGSDHVEGCKKDTKVWAKVEEGAEPPKCTELAKQDPSFTLLNPSNSSEGVKITFPEEKDPITEKKHQVIVELKCDMEKTKIAETPFTVSVSTDGIYTIKGESRFGCPAVSFEQLITFISNNKYVFASVFSVIGLILTFFGLKFINFAVFAITATAGTAISGMFIYQFTDVTSGQALFWGLFLVCLVLGLALGYAALKLEKVAIFLVGGVLGFIGGDLLYLAVIHPMLSVPVNPNIYRVVVILCVIVVGAIAFFIFETVFIIATSVIGSYIVVRVLSTFIGHFPAEINISQGVSQLDAWAYGYLVAIIIIALLGMRKQFIDKSKQKKDGEDLEENLPKYGYAYYKY